MKNFSLALTLSAICFCLSAQGQDYLQQFGSQPVPVINRTGGANNKMFLMGEESGELVFRYNVNNPAEIILPLNTPGLALLYRPPEQEYENALSLINNEHYDRAVENMRPYAYPLVRFIEVPASSFNIHTVLDRFVYALASSDNVQEAAKLMEQLPLTQVDPQYIDYAFTVVGKLVDAGSTQQALQLLNRIPLSKKHEEVLPKVMSFANQLRESGYPSEALFLYERIQNIPDTKVRKEAILWTAYCNMETGRTQTAELFVEKAGEIDEDERAFSLKKLVQGRLAMLSDDTNKAMAAIAHGVVNADISYPWTPELFYCSGTLYEKIGRADVAREIYGEIDLFFGSTQWGEKSRAQMENLPSGS